MVPYVCSGVLRWIKFLAVVLDKLFFHLGDEKWLLVALDRWSSYTVRIVQEFAWMDLVLALQRCHLNRFDCNALS